MRKIFLTTTILLTTGTALAFGGVFNHGSKSTTYKGGVDAIGVHFGGEKKAADSEQAKVTCSLPYVLNEEKNGCECPAERQCGNTCCGEGNACVDGNKCCYQDFDGNIDEGLCCNADESMGYASWANGYQGECCAEGLVPYIEYFSVVEPGGTACCLQPYQTWESPHKLGEEMAYSYIKKCCTDTLYKGVGYNGWDVCCDHEPEDYEGYDGVRFKVCWTEATNCKSNADCGKDEYCRIVIAGDDQDLSFPDQGTCEPIGSAEMVEITGLGSVVKSEPNMTWWSANNWCKAQGKNLIDVGAFECYVSDSQVLIEEYALDAETVGGCCAKGKVCDWDTSWPSDAFSPVIVELEQTFGNGLSIWTASHSTRERSEGGLIIYFDHVNNPMVCDEMYRSGNGYGGNSVALCK